MSEPPRLLDTRKGQLTERLLRAGAAEKPPQRSLQRAFAAAAVASSATAISATSAASAAVAKAVVVWLAVGGLGGVAVGTLAVTLKAPATESRSNTHQAATPPPRAVDSCCARRSTATAIAASTPAPAASVAEEPTRSPRPVPRAAVSRVASAAATVLSAHREPPTAPNPQPAASTREFSQELALIDDAQRRLSAGDPRGALAVLARYRSEFAVGNFTPEALALEVQAESARGQRAAAERSAQLFLSNYPNHPLAARVRSALQR
jgi:hypothetical protein